MLSFSYACPKNSLSSTSCIRAVPHNVMCICLLQKLRLNTHRKKPFGKLVAEIASGRQHDDNDIVTDTPSCSANCYAVSCPVVNSDKNSATGTDFNCNVARLDSI